MAELRLQVSTVTASVPAPDALASELLTDFAAARGLSAEGTAQERLQRVAEHLAQFIHSEANTYRTNEAMRLRQLEVNAENEARQWA